MSDAQCEFIKGRQIFYGIMVANEIIHSIKKYESLGRSLILKLDFSKAYDCVRSGFLDLVLFHMVLWAKWRGWIPKSISTARAFFLVNGSTTNEFRISKGLRQGI